MNSGKIVIITDGQYKGRIGTIIGEKGDNYSIKLAHKNMEEFVKKNKGSFKNILSKTIQIDNKLGNLVAGRKSKRKSKKRKSIKKRKKKQQNKKVIKIKKNKVKILSIII